MFKVKVVGLSKKAVEAIGFKHPDDSYGDTVYRELDAALVAKKLDDIPTLDTDENRSWAESHKVSGLFARSTNNTSFAIIPFDSFAAAVEYMTIGADDGNFSGPNRPTFIRSDGVSAQFYSKR